MISQTQNIFAEKLAARKTPFQAALARWYAAHRRHLPWRENPSLYKTVVSEFMCQQTQIDTVLPYFARWMSRWENFQALANAAEAEIVRAWEGLGYYNRARNLRKLAGVISEKMPAENAAAWRELPGIGAYTAAAICSISFNEKIAVVDGNVIRVLTRLSADGRVFKGNDTAAKSLFHLAQNLLNDTAPGAHNQAMMELGALVCKRRNPRCGECPVAEFCAAFANGTAANFPRFSQKKSQKISIKRAWIFHENALVLRRVNDTARRLSGICELPFLEMAPAEFHGKILAKKRRAISNQQIEETIVEVRWNAALAEILKNDTALFRAEISDLKNITLSGPHRKWISFLLGNPE